MNLLFVSEYFPPKIMGGGEINLSLLAAALAKKTMTVSVITSYHPGLPRFEKVDRVHIYRLLQTGESPNGIINNFKRSFLFPKSIEKEVAELHHRKKFTQIHFMGTSIIAAAKLQQLNVPLIATIESYPTLCPKGDRIFHGKQECKTVCTISKFVSCQRDSTEIGKMNNKWYFKYNPLFLLYVYNHYTKLKQSLLHCHLIAISKYVHNVLRHHGVESTIIPNALNTSAFVHQAARKPGKKRILYLGSLTAFKGPQLLLEAMTGIDCHCDIYGEGPLRKKLQQIIVKNNLDAEIHPPVPSHQIPSLYSAADIVVFPSRWPEPFGRIAIEAMAAGKPVIGADIGGIRETIMNGTGMLFQPNNVQDLRHKLKELLQDTKQYQTLAREGPLKAQRYKEATVVVQLLKEYKKIAS
ncbi:MAG: glycosyltransferase family 4 protein [Nanoarchaeota archaeon]|nr:glycosyltransferase family 4 protein [Nanoarchaeota archaeon]